MVYHYHPIGFVVWLNEKLGAGKPAGPAITAATAADFATATGSAKGDLDDKEGTSFVSADDLKVVPETEKLKLEDMIEGYGD